MKENAYEAVVFDLDGTLVDSIGDIADAMNRTLRHFGYPTHSDEEYKLLVGRGLRRLSFDSLPAEERAKEAVVEACFRRLMEDYGRNYLHKTRLYEGIPALLDALSARKLRLAVLSNKADEIVGRVCGALLKDWPFALTLGASERFPRKPAPEAALYVAETLGVSPQSTLYLGDTGIDMQTAVAAGMLPVGATWGFRSAKELRANGAKAIVDHPIELLYVAMG